MASSSREGFASSARYGAGLLTESSRLIATGQQPPQSSTIYQSGYNLSTTQQPGLNPQYQPTTSYVAGSSGLRTSGYEATSSLYQPSSSSTYQVGTYPGQSGLYQPGTYQPGQYQTSQYTSQASYQLSGQSNYQPYQSTSGLYSSSSSIYRSGYQPPKPSEGGSKWFNVISWIYDFCLNSMYSYLFICWWFIFLLSMKVKFDFRRIGKLKRINQVFSIRFGLILSSKMMEW